MKNILIVALLFISSCSGMGYHGLDNFGQNYVPGTEDLPVYTGFQPVDTKNIAYDSMSGRIIDASYYNGNVVAEDVNNFYSETLPQLGWKRSKASEYVRDGEKLKINISEKKGVTFLKFIIRPVV